MKILLTGEPRIGKSTLLRDFVERVPNKMGFAAQEILEDGIRVGFEVVSSNGQQAVLAHTNSTSDLRLGRYGINTSEFNNFLAKLPSIEVASSDTLLYIDEIGRMQLFADSFKQVVKSYLDAKNIFVGAITKIYTDDFIQSVRERKDVIILEVDQNNRDQIADVLAGLRENSSLLLQLSQGIEDKLIIMARDYVSRKQWTLLKKLFKNAIKYVAEKRVTQLNVNTYTLPGNTNHHTIKNKGDTWVCDCDLFNGRGAFSAMGGDCSHIQSVLLLQADTTGVYSAL